jgi:hypothetical protein
VSFSTKSNVFLKIKRGPNQIGLAQAIPTYTLGVLKLPTSLCRQKNQDKGRFIGLLGISYSCPKDLDDGVLRFVLVQPGLIRKANLETHSIPRHSLCAIA